MLRSVYTKTLRDMRWGILGWGLGFGLLVIVNGLGWSIAYPDAASRSELALQIRSGLSVAQAFYGPPRNVDTLGGFLEWRALGLAPVLLGLYLILAATGTTRGAEESRTIEVIAATPKTQSRLFFQQSAAIATAIVGTVTIMACLTMMSGLISGEATPRLPRVAGAYANVAAGSLIFGALGLLAAQVFSRRRTAALAATAVMVLVHLANTLPLVVPALSGVRYTSPLYLYTRSSPLANGHLDWMGLAGLLLVAAATIGLALWTSQRRDLFDTFRFRGRQMASADASVASSRTGPARPDLFLRNSLGRGLRDAVGTTAGWAAGLGMLAVLMTALVPNMRVALLKQPNSVLFKGLVTEKALLSGLLYSFLLPPLVMAFGVTLAGAWAADELNERLELELVAPVHRWKIMLQRLVAAGAAQAGAVAVVALAVLSTIELLHIDVPMTSVAAASFALLLLAVSAIALAFAIASWKPQLTAAAAGAFVAVSFFANLLIPLFDLPSWIRYLSVFGLYGAPLANGVSYWRMAVLAAAALAFATLGAVAFQRRDITK